MRAFMREFDLSPAARILDVGGTPGIWSTASAGARIVLLNMPRARAEAFTATLGYVEGDACHLPFADRSFDVVFSNSVIEHVGSAGAQERFAQEVARVGRGYWIQTPNRNFPIETHLLMPLVHLLPKRWAAFVVQRFSLWALIHRPLPAENLWYLEHVLGEVRLCSTRDLRRLFPDASIREERSCLFTESLIAVRNA